MTKHEFQDTYKWAGVCNTTGSVTDCRNMLHASAQGTAATASAIQGKKLWLVDQDNSNVHNILYEAKSIGNANTSSAEDKAGQVATLALNSATDSYTITVKNLQAVSSGLTAVDKQHATRWSINTFAGGDELLTNSSSDTLNSRGWTNVKLAGQTS